MALPADQQHPPLAISGKTMVAGELLFELTVAPAFRPGWTNEFALIRWGGHEGTFTNLPAGSRIHVPRRLGSFGVHYRPEELVLTDYFEDLDGDGVDDSWAMYNFGKTPLSSAELMDDADGDGLSNFAEAIAGTDPLDPESAFRMTEFSLSGERLRLRFNHNPVKRHRIWQANSRWTWTEFDSPRFLFPEPGIAEWVDFGVPHLGKAQYHRVSID